MTISVPASAKSNRIPPIDDILAGKERELWGRLGWLEVKRRYPAPSSGRSGARSAWAFT